MAVTYKINKTILTFEHLIYVATNGDDVKGDGSKENPFASFVKAESVAVEGDAIIFGKGIYQLSMIVSWIDLGISALCFLAASKNISLIGHGKNTILVGDNTKRPAEYRDCYFLGPYYNKGEGNLTLYNLHLKFITNVSGYPGAFIHHIAPVLYNCVIENIYAGGWMSLIYDNEKHGGGTFINCIINSQLSVDYSNKTKELTNCILSVNYENVTLKQNTIARAITANDVDEGIAPDLLNKGLATIKNVDGSISNIGINGGPFAWYAMQASYLYLNASYAVFTVRNNEFVKIADDWRTQTDTDKQALFKQGITDISMGGGILN